MTALNQNDYTNLLALLQRVTVQGLNEAEAIVVLAAKLRVAAEAPRQQIEVTTPESAPDQA